MRFCALIVFLCVWTNVSSKCVMRGECYFVDGFDKPCPVDIEAPYLAQELEGEERDEIISILANTCPNLIYDEDGNRIPDEDIRACCEAEQIRKMTENINIAEGVLGRCPACFRNFVRQICEMNCALDQDRFVEVFVTNGTNDTPYVYEINYRVHGEFLDDAHSSCANVLVPQTGMPAINMMCGNAPVCTADAWFGFTGNTSINPLAPVQVNFLRTNITENSMNVRALSCNETYGDDLPCSCVDCPAQCPVSSPPVVPEQCTVLSVNCIAFSIGLCFFVINVAIFTFLTFRAQIKSQSKNVPNSNKIITFFQSLFSGLGSVVADNAILVIMLTSWFAFSMVFGALSLNLTANPIELWSSPDSQSRVELNYFNSRFGPFYRAAQVFMRFNADPFEVNNVTYGPAFRFEAIQEFLKLENAIKNIGRDDDGVKLEQVCYAPLRMRGAEPNMDECVTMSVSTYLGGELNNNTYLNNIQNCINNFYAMNCMASWGGGADPEITFGGYDDDILRADTLLMNFPISNYLLKEDLAPVLEWEGRFIELLKIYEQHTKPDYIEIAFGAERSIEDEIQRVSVAEAIPIAISYLLMFFYVVFALGNIRYCKTWLVDSKVTVAIGSIIVVVIAIMCAMGVMGYIGITATLLAINVIPFFVLSVGIDNVFLMVNALHDIETNLKSYDDYNDNFDFDEKRKFVFSKMLGKVGPSMFVASVTQVTCFAIGSLANFPAVVTFAVFASFSLGFLFVFQVTTVVAILSLDYKRAHENRLDIFCCVQKKFLNDDNPLHADTPHQSVTKRLMEPYSKFILNSRTKLAVAILFAGMVFASVMMIPSLEIGLDQEMALPPDSYVYKYLQAVNTLMHLGPPVYFVLKEGLNFTNVDHQNTICGGQLCYDDSLFMQIFLAAQHSNMTYISRSSNSWIDDFFDWSSLTGSCCRYNIADGSFCSSSNMSSDCDYCSIERDEWANGLRPAGEAFEKYIPFFLQDAPTEICNKGGLASYFSNVNYILDSEGHATVGASNFMAYHTNLRTSKDYIGAVRNGYEISHSISKAISNHTGVDIEVFPYSVFYVYYEQYLTMWKDTFASIGFCLLGALLFNLLVTGFNYLTTFAVIFTAVMVVLNMMGVMYIWNIPLNAVSCVNLIVSIGIAVEFCSHIAYAFATSQAPRSERVEDAIKSVGATIITGITFTNIPIIILAFSYTEIIEVFFFRMLFSLVILGFLHGMVFLPVLLSYLNDLGKDKVMTSAL